MSRKRKWQGPVPRAIVVLAVLAVAIGFRELNELVGGPANTSRLVGLAVLFVIAVAAGSIGLIRSERRRHDRDKQ